MLGESEQVLDFALEVPEAPSGRPVVPRSTKTDHRDDKFKSKIAKGQRGGDPPFLVGRLSASRIGFAFPFDDDENLHDSSTYYATKLQMLKQI